MSPRLSKSLENFVSLIHPKQSANDEAVGPQVFYARFIQFSA